MTSTSREKFFDTLGPGCYSPRDTSSGPRWGFGSSKRREIIDSESPGPGAYTIKKEQTRAYSLYSRRDTNQKTLTPGPGSYNPKIMETSLRYSLGKKHVEVVRNPIPGPGRYSPSIIADSIFTRYSIFRLKKVDKNLKFGNGAQGKHRRYASGINSPDLSIEDIYKN